MNPSLEVRWSSLVSRNSDINPSATLVEIRGLKKSFDNQVVLAGVDLDLRRGHTVALLGVSGSGKSVLMKCVLGLIEPDAGSVRIDGHETVDLGQTERLLLMRKVGVLFQNGALFDSLPVWENVAFTLLSSRRVSRGCARRVAAAALTRVGLGADVIDLLPGELSGGMQKRVSLARALVGHPEILFLDNPTAGLDPVLTGIIDSSVAASLEHLQAIALVITHDLTSAQRIADRAAFLSEGRIVWEGATGELWRSDLQQIQKFLRATGSHSRHRAG